MRLWVNFQQLQYIKSIVENGSIAKASLELRVSSPALSMQLKSLEEKFDEKIFERKNKKLIITNFGKQIYEYSLKLHELQEDILEFVNSKSYKERGKIEIGLTDGLPKVLSLLAASEYKKLAPESVISLQESNTNELANKLLTNKLDIAFCNIPISDIEGDLVCQEFAEQNVSLYGTSKFKNLKKNYPRSLNNAPFILPSLHSNIRHSVDYWFLDNKITYQKIIEVQDSSVKKILASEGLGLVPLPEFGAKPLIDSKQLIKIGELEGVTEKYYWMAKKNSLEKKPHLKKLINNMKNLIAN